jgi:hypothetical protein
MSDGFHGNLSTPGGRTLPSARLVPNARGISGLRRMGVRSPCWNSIASGLHHDAHVDADG